MQPTSLEEIQTNQNGINAVRVLAPVFFYFVAAGIATVMLGPLLPSLIQHWQIRDAQAGTLFTANFVGELCGSWFAARNLKASVLYGSALTALGCVTLSWLSFGVAHIAFFAIGTGLGAGLTAGNIIAGTAIPALRSRLIAMLNVAWGVGAIACPLLIRLTASGGIHRFLHATAISLAFSTLFAMTIPNPERSATLSERSLNLSTQTPRTANSGMPLPALYLFAFSAAMFLYVGIENALGGWLPSYAVRSNPLLQASSISLVFWIAELIGRLLVAALMIVLTESALYRICITLLIAVEVLLCVTAHPSSGVVIALTVLTALSLAPMYPLILSFLLARTGNHARLGVFFASGCCGGAMLPWFTGVLSTRLHGLRAGLLIPAAGAGILLLISSLITTKRTATIEAGP